VGSSAAAAGTRIKKRKKKSAKRTKKAPSRLEGEALRNELMRREKREEERVLAVNTLFYRSRAYNVSRRRGAVSVSLRAGRWCSAVNRSMLP